MHTHSAAPQSRAPSSGSARTASLQSRHGSPPPSSTSASGSDSGVLMNGWIVAMRRQSGLWCSPARCSSLWSANANNHRPPCDHCKPFSLEHRMSAAKGERACGFSRQRTTVPAGPQHSNGSPSRLIRAISGETYPPQNHSSRSRWSLGAPPAANTGTQSSRPLGNDVSLAACKLSVGGSPSRNMECNWPCRKPRHCSCQIGTCDRGHTCAPRKHTTITNRTDFCPFITRRHAARAGNQNSREIPKGWGFAR
eukprot:SAG22_NODE_1084_length_5637_cov_2.170820_4_plen_252_part_00